MSQDGRVVGGGGDQNPRKVIPKERQRRNRTLGKV